MVNITQPKKLSTMRALSVVLQKEWRDHLRDRRTLLMILTLSVAMGPLLLIFLANVIGGITEKTEKREIQIVGRSNAPELVNYMQRQNMNLIDAVPDYKAKVRKGELDAVLVIKPEFKDDFGAGETAKVELVYDDSRTAAGPSIGAVRGMVRGFNSEVASQRLIMRGVSPSINKVVEVEDANMATPKQRAATAMLFLPLLLLAACATGGMSMAIDVTSGERERGSLEPLLMNAVPMPALVIGKWLAVSSYAIGVVVLTSLGLWATLRFYPIPNLEGVFSISFMQLMWFYAILLPFAFFASAAQMLVATYGRTYKEAQTYLSYMLTAVNLGPALLFATGGKEAAWHYWVPAVAQVAAVLKVLKGDAISFVAYGLPLLVCAGLTTVCLVMVGKLWTKEDVIFGKG